MVLWYGLNEVGSWLGSLMLFSLFSAGEMAGDRLVQDGFTPMLGDWLVVGRSNGGD